MSSKRILVTGAAGFIGFHLANALQAKGHAVVGYDNFNDYYDPEIKRARASQLQKLGVHVVVGDVCNQLALQELVNTFKPTHIAHMAAQAGVRYSVTHPQSYLQSNLDGFGQVLEICRRQPEVKLVYASSSSVYGLNSKTPFAESDSTDHPASLYAATKKANEVMAHAYHHLYGLSVTGLRFFTVYGPWGRPDMAYWTFTKSISEGSPIDVFHGGNMRRDFTYVDDIVAGIQAALEHCDGYHVYNLGNDQPEELMHLIHLIESAVGKKAVIQYKPMQAGDVVSTWADLTLSRKELGYAPQVPLSEGIAKFVEWYSKIARPDRFGLHKTGVATK